MAIFSFLNENNFEVSPISNLWRLKDNVYEIPALPGVYFLIARPNHRFVYPAGESSIYYIGQASSLRGRLLEHLKFSEQVRDDNRRTGNSLYYPRYEYGAAFGARYCFIRTRQGYKPKNFEDLILARFAKKYRAFPVANSAGAWNRIEAEFKNI